MIGPMNLATVCDVFKNYQFLSQSILVLHSWNANLSRLTAMEVLSDESIVLCGGNWGIELTHHNRKCGKVIYRKQLKNWAGGLTEVKYGNQHYLALSFKIPEEENKRWVDLK